MATNKWNAAGASNTGTFTMNAAKGIYTTGSVYLGTGFTLAANVTSVVRG